jgi:hypothetical protein
VNLLGQKALTGFTGQLEDIQHGSLLDIAEPRGSANAVAFNKAMKDSAHRLLREPHVASERRLTRLREPLAALLALPPLRVIPSASGFNGLDFARMACHFGPCFLQSESSK